MANQNLSFKVANLGNLQSGEFTQKPLTVFCGPNNSGKTWTMYSLYSFYKLLDGAESRGSINELVAEYLPAYLNVSKNKLMGARFDCSSTAAEWRGFAREISAAETNIFLMPAERSGLYLFLRGKNIDNKDAMHLRCAKPIADYIDWLNQIPQINPNRVFRNEVMYLQRKILGGRYHLSRRTGDITFTPYQKKGKTGIKNLLLHSTSSGAKSFFCLWFYLAHQAKVGDVLIIDEPEIDIHPQNQLLLTHLLVRLVKKGINVVISTHSDYIVREVNNLIMLGEHVLSPNVANEDGDLLEKVNKINRGHITYEKDAFLSADKVGMYSFGGNTISPMKYVDRQGFAVETFDEVIVRQNETNLELYHGLMEGGDD